MPARPKRPCSFPGCPNFVTSGYCEQHQQRRKYCAETGCKEIVSAGKYCSNHGPKAKHDERRGSSSKRGYNKTWEKVRKNYLARFPLCERCKEQGRITSAVLVHHIKPIRQGGERLNPDNLQALCVSCHALIHGEMERKVNKC
jgi:5-methylcytosine-specific restriction protein A